MTTKTKQTKNADAADAQWVEKLALCIDSIGQESFYLNLEAALKVLADFNVSVAYAYYKSQKPLCLAHTFTSKKRRVLIDDYLKGAYLLDPFFKACRHHIDAGLYRIGDIAPDRFYQSEYYLSYYKQTGLSEEICYTFYLEKDVAVVISLMRAGEKSRFSARQFRLLGSVAPIVISIAKRHWQAVPDQFHTTHAKGKPLEDDALIAGGVSDMFAERLTPRETQVVEQVLEGHSSDSIAKDLGISVGTVRIHRRNIYAKLRISSQQELFAIFFKNLKSKVKNF